MENELREALVTKCLQMDFPETLLSEESLLRDFGYLKNTQNLSPRSNTCMALIQYFHPSLWRAHLKNHLSPYQAWHDPKCLVKCINNRLKYKGAPLSPENIRAGFSIGKIAPKVSIFRPALARYLIEKYLPDYTEIFDPCSGYSGRLLGAMAANKVYVGQDINPITIKEAQELSKFFNFDNALLTNRNSLATSGNYESLFTCPPYADKENWNQSIEDLTCDEWIDVCRSNYKCNRYLFVIDQTKKYSKYIVEELINSSYLCQSKECVVLI